MSENSEIRSTRFVHKKKNLLPAEVDAQLKSQDRRRFLGQGMAIAGATLASGVAGAAPLPVPGSNQGMGKPIPAIEERARSELGMIRHDEIFFQVLEASPPAAAQEPVAR